MSAPDAKSRLTIRPFDPAHDARSLCQCVIEHQDFHRGLEPSWPAGEPIAAEYVAYLEQECSLRNGCILIAHDGQDTAGFVCVVASTRGASPDDPEPYAWIQDIFVMPAWRRRGVASLLLAEAERFARDQGARHLRLGVLDRNPDARTFYERHGFREYTHVLTKPLS
jgi:GNAT superfamily N-acetyltransferase